MTDWLSEVLDDLHFKGALPLGFVNDGKPHQAESHASGDGCVSQAHKLISAQLIREKIQELQWWDEAIKAGATHRSSMTQRIADLTNKLKELEDETL